MKRRILLAGGLAAGATAVAEWAWLESATSGWPTAVRYPGREVGHRFRDAASSTAFDHVPVQRQVDVLIIGSGVAALSCAWALQRAGHRNFALVEGPAPLGNSASGTHRFSAYPQGAHYLPVPSRGCGHVRSILHDLGVLLEGVKDEQPLYDERFLVHASVERVLHEGRWHSGLLPHLPEDGSAASQWKQLTTRFEAFRQASDATGRAVFDIPLVHSASLQPGQPARELDQQSFAEWLNQQGVTDPTLRWYFDYCCRDEYGVDANLTSAWAGAHYFCGRRGQARHAEPGAVLTWPQGLGFLAQGLKQKLAKDQAIPGTALKIRRSSEAHEVLVMSESGQPQLVRARKLVIATPLFIARRLAPAAFEGLEAEPGPQMSPWMVANFFLSRFPAERPGEALSWDNVISGSTSLGYVVATHQAIRAALPDGTVFTTYHALGKADNKAQRDWLMKASAKELADLASRDLDAAYGRDWRRWCEGAEITVHGHAMAVPSPGFLSNPVTARARQATKENNMLLFAHSDLSGYSVFEEASYWGVEAAGAITGHNL